MTQKLWKVADVAAYFEVSNATVYRWAENGKIPANAIRRTPGGGLRFDPEQIKNGGKDQ